MNGSPDSDSGAPQKEEPAPDSVAIKPPIVPPGTAANQKTDNGQSGPKKKKRSSKRSYRKWTLIINGILAAAAIGAGWFYYRQLKEMKRATGAAIKATQLTERSLKLAEITARLDQRAWVATSEVNGILQAGQPFVSRVKVKNTGKTFARNVQVRVRAEIVRKGGDPTFANIDYPPKLATLILAPNADFEQKTKPLENSPFSEDQISNIRDNQELFVFGRIDYTDVFDRKHWTTFCFRYNILDRDYEYYEKHNDADNRSGD